MDFNSKLGKLGSINVRIEEDDWLSEVKSCLKSKAAEVEEEVERLSRSSVFNVPKELKAIKETAFIPQAVSIGPYHHCRSELYEMERYKLAATRRFQNRCTNLYFEDTIVADLKSIEWEIRNCYDKYIDCKSDTLAWLMAVDAVFVLECLQIFVRKVDKESNASGAEVKQLGRVLDPSGKTSTHNTVVRDLTMLENQIPLFIVKKLLELQLGSEEKAEERLTQLLSMCVTELSPFGGLRLSDRAKAMLSKRGHLLESLYYALVPVATMETEKDEQVQDEPEEILNPEKVTTTAQKAWSIASSLNLKPFKKVLSVLKSVAKLPMELLSVAGRLPVLKTLKGPLSVFFNTASTAMDSNKKTDREASSDTVIEVPPTRDELVVPCVRSLKSAGVKFAPVDGNITSVKFDEKTKTLHLPKIRIDSNTDVLIRNLVAFESAAAPGGVMAFTRYIDFINGMVDNAEDVKILKSSGIISHRLQSDVEVANLWNGMGGCVRLTKVEYLDKAVDGLNRFYAKNWMVKTMDMIRNYVFGSWQMLSLSAALMMLSLTGLEAVCSVYDCQKWFEDDATMTGSNLRMTRKFAFSSY